VLRFEQFKRALENVPQHVMVDFAGFSEPFLNPECVDMILHAYYSGHRVEVKSTLIGLLSEDIARITHIPFGAFWYHDTNQEADWIEREQAIRKTYPFITQYQRVTAPTSRAGNLYPEAKREGIGICVRSAEHKVNVMLPNCDVVLCCNDYGLKHKLGNLLETNFEDLERNNVYDLCYLCPDWIVA
jgi:hypothetical protein